MKISTKYRQTEQRNSTGIFTFISPSAYLTIKLDSQYYSRYTKLLIKCFCSSSKFARTYILFHYDDTIYTWSCKIMRQWANLTISGWQIFIVNFDPADWWSSQSRSGYWLSWPVFCPRSGGRFRVRLCQCRSRVLSQKIHQQRPPWARTACPRTASNASSSGWWTNCWSA